ncbi:MAG: 4-(cytidine 5'-diphospho)-2-C-methyl-D-erythritol kinase [Nitrospirae bacterium]|nr:MAG: 4-(cytidine 5'-diphospho)-2-C-methyl-D-erythritol kinase [Nitrospirota bacterium]
MLTLKSPAKINWCLRVLGKRPDGYHDIWSVMQKIDLFDTLHFRRTPGGISVYTEPDIGVRPEENLVYRAAHLFKNYTSCPFGVEVYLKKEIPAQAGLGGGSSNAATTLLALNRLWDSGLDKRALMGMAKELGSDVPFFLSESLAVVQGRGERITPLEGEQRKRWLLLVKPSFGVSTKEAYSGLDRYSTSGIDITGADVFLKGSDEELCPYLINDLEKVAFRLYPELSRLKERLLEGGSLCALMSGSGSALFGLFPSRQDAEVAAKGFNDCWHRVVSTYGGKDFL